MQRTFFLFIGIVCCIYFSFGQEKSGGYIHGLIVGDYFYKTSGDAQPFGGMSQFSQPLPKDSSAFQIDPGVEKLALVGAGAAPGAQALRPPEDQRGCGSAPRDVFLLHRTPFVTLHGL